MLPDEQAAQLLRAGATGRIAEDERGLAVEAGVDEASRRLGTGLNP